MAGVIGLLPLLVEAQATSPTERPNPEKVVTAESCGECHIAEYEVWKKTPHATGFKTLHRKASAEAIAEKMGLRLIKRDSRCLNCHYTPTVQNQEPRAVSGVSCESCHGAGRDWIDVHNDYGGKGVDHNTETAEHREQRIALSRVMGMRRPSDLYPVVSNCFSCHTVPDEKLVNVGGHSTGSGNFEFVSWSQGELRHNFLQSFLTGDGSENVQRALPRQRMMYVVGRLVDLEFSLRGIAAATEEGIYLKAMLRRARLALSEAQAIATAEPIPEVREILALVKKTPLALGQKTALLAAADDIGQRTRRFLAAWDGARLAAIDPLLTEDRAAAVVAEGETASTTAVSSTGASSTGSTTGDRTTGARRTLGPGACSGCHAEQNRWWLNDPHATSADPFFDQRPANVEIARLYGIAPDNMALGTTLCMTCHGTVVTGRERRQAQDGVSCESCHGAAEGYLEPHREGEKSLGTERPGYRKALQLGMSEMLDHDVRARSCTSCHYITDERLLATGHPSGATFDYVAGMAKVRHWDEPLASPAVLTAALRTAVDQRGPIPAVEVITRPPAAVVATTATSPAKPATGTSPATLPETSPSQAITGRIKTSVHPKSRFRTLGPAACSACHTPQNNWWPDDRHYRSADPFFESSPRHLQIARLYGLASGQMTRGNQICMDCHGSVISGKEGRQVQDGVSCESCHGPAADFIEPHKEGDKALGADRPGYIEALRLGMRELRDDTVRAETCVGCHHIMEPRLIAAGHKTGLDFNYTGGMVKIKHWERQDAPDTLARAVKATLAKRGVTFEQKKAAGEPVSAPTALLPRPAADTAVSDVASANELGLPPLPDLDDANTTIESLLLELEKRFTALYRRAHGQSESP